MPTIIEIKEKEVIKKAVLLVNKGGWDELNARSLAKSLNISTKPLYRMFGGMDEIKEKVHTEIYNIYDSFVNDNVDNKNPLLSICSSYVEFAQKYSNLFITLFLSNNLKWNNIMEVMDEKWNQATVINLVTKQGMNFKDAKDLFLNVWLYSNGLATLVATNEIKIGKEEIKERICEVYEKFKK